MTTGAGGAAVAPAYFDAALVAKFYLNEPGRDQVRQLARASGVVVTSGMAVAEVSAAFHRKLREGAVGRPVFRALQGQFVHDLEAGLWQLAGPTEALLRDVQAAVARLEASLFLPFARCAAPRHRPCRGLYADLLERSAPARCLPSAPDPRCPDSAPEAVLVTGGLTMTRSTFVLATVAVATMAAASAGARQPVGTPAPVIVLNSQLRGIINPEIVPTAAWGHVQVKLTETADGTWAPDWKGRLYNPDGHQFTAGFVIDLDADGGGDPGDPSDGGGIILDSAVLDLFTDASASCGIIDFESQAITDEEHLPADVAQRMIIDPEIFGVVLVSTDGSIVFGRFGPGDPEPVSGDGLGGKPVRCAAGD